jgi:DNA-binding GntR family transcriptional regulator
MVSIRDLPQPVFSERRRTSLEVHAHLRQLIIDSALPPGTVLKQAELARQFNVSRTPMREAFRMLQAEGLIEADLNQRGRVRGFDPEELDQLYGARITLESLAARITTGRMSSEEVDEAWDCLARMDGAGDDMVTWVQTHRRFHRLCMARAGEPLVSTINSYSERSERYLRLYQIWHPASFAAARADHEEILRAVQGTDDAYTGECMAKHLAHTARTVMADVSADARAHAIDAALAMAVGARTRKRAKSRLPASKDE